MKGTRQHRIYLSTPTSHGDEERYIHEAFTRNWLAPLGFHCDAFEAEVCDYLAARGGQGRSALCLSSGTAALHLALKLCGIGRGDVVLCSDMTFAASVNPVCYEGAEPVFVDAERESWNMDPTALEAAFAAHPNARAVILVHLYGTPARTREIRQICRAHGAVLIEDAAEAMAARDGGEPCGALGDLGVFSFNGNKIITTSGGGMLITQSEQQRARALHLATQAREDAPWYEHREVGYNYRMSNLLAGMGRAQLTHLEEHRARKAEIYRRYAAGLSGLPVTMNPYRAGTEPNFWLSCLLIERGCAVTPTAVADALAKQNIETRPLWKPMHLQPVFRQNEYSCTGGASVTEDLFSRGLCLPSDIKMTEEEQDEVIAAIRACF